MSDEKCACGANKVPGTAWCFTCNPEYQRGIRRAIKDDDPPDWYREGCRPADHGYRPEYNPRTHNSDGSEKP